MTTEMEQLTKEIKASSTASALSGTTLEVLVTKSERRIIYLRWRMKLRRRSSALFEDRTADCWNNIY